MFELELMSLNGKRKVQNVKSVIIPTSDGNRTVLDKHMDIVVEVVPGVAKLRTEKDIVLYFVSNGIFHFSKSKGTMIVDTYESTEDIDFLRAHRALDHASSVLHESHDDFEIKKAEQALKRALGRLRLE